MSTASNIELLRLTAAIGATEVQLARERVKLRAVAQQEKTTISIDGRVAVFVRGLVRLRALRINIPPDRKGEA